MMSGFQPDELKLQILPYPLIQKPFSMKTLAQKIHTILSQKPFNKMIENE